MLEVEVGGLKCETEKIKLKGLGVWLKYKTPVPQKQKPLF
jgi:hypothetical protein